MPEYLLTDVQYKHGQNNNPVPAIIAYHVTATLFEGANLFEYYVGVVYGRGLEEQIYRTRASAQFIVIRTDRLGG